MSNLLNIEQAAAFLGVSKFMLYRLSAEKKIPLYKVGSCLRFSQEQLEEWLKKREVVPAEAARKGA
jgi:excisionase family DNA binding protein